MPRRSVAFAQRLRSSVALTCTDSAPPGLAASQAAGPDEPGQSPTRLVSGYSPRLSVVPNAAIPPYPAHARPAIFDRRLLSYPQRTGPLDPACLTASVKLTSSFLGNYFKGGRMDLKRTADVLR